MGASTEGRLKYWDELMAVMASEIGALAKAA